MKILFWIGIIAVFGIITLFSTENIVQEQIQSNDIKSAKNQIKLESTTTQLVSANIPVSTQIFNSEYVITKLPDTSTPNSAIQKAYGITSTQSSLSVTTWTGGDYRGGFDSSWNVFAPDGQTKISFINIGNNTKKTWIIPNENFVASNMVVDSNGYASFTSTFPSTEESALMRLNPNTNEFTKYSFGNSGYLHYLDIDSSNNIYFTSGNTGELFEFFLSTNTLKKWTGICINIFTFNVDSSGNVYCPTIHKLQKFNTSTNTLTTWTLPTLYVIKSTTDSSGNVFFTEYDGLRSKIGKITIIDNTLTEWIIPTEESNFQNLSGIAVDSSGNVFFSGADNHVWRLVPSTDTFTNFGVECFSNFKFEPSGALHCVRDNGFFSKIT